MAKEHQVAALPVRRPGGGGLEVLLVTSRDTGRWVVPKGWPWRKVADHEAAAGEAWEEAGVRGRISSEVIGTFTYLKRRNSKSHLVSVSVFVLEVVEEAGDWPEIKQRRRQWFAPDEAAGLVHEPDLKQLLQSLAGTEPALDP